MRFWSLTCPWRNPIGVSLPDDARQEHDAHLASDAMTAGKYLVEFIVRDPWLPETKPERPLVTFALFAYNQERFDREAVEGQLPKPTRTFRSFCRTTLGRHAREVLLETAE